MSNQEPSPSSQSPVGERIPHSGVHGFEKPVTEFDKPLRDAHAEGLLTDPNTAEARAELLRDPATAQAATPGEKRAERQRRLPGWARNLVGTAVISTVLGGGAIAYQAKKASDFLNELNDAKDKPVATAPEVPGEDINDTPEFRFTLQPAVVTDAEAATLKAGDSEESHKILDKKLIPKIQEAVDQIRQNGGVLDGLDLTALAPSEKAVLSLAQINGLVSDNEVQICHTTPNIDGSVNFCGPSNFTRIELGKPIEFYFNDYETEKDHHFKSDVHAEIVDGNQLILSD